MVELSVSWSELSQIGAQIFGALLSLGFAGWLALALRYFWHRMRMAVFFSLVETWADQEYQSFRIDRDDFPDETTLRIMTANWLYESWFSAKEIRQDLETATLLARARILHVVRMEEDND